MTIEGFNFDDNLTETGSFSIPPDPIGAAGPSHVTAVVNRMVEWHTKAGTFQFRDALVDFFGSLSPQSQPFDPKVLYDQHSSRFLIVALELLEVAPNDPANVSRILLAVSDDSDPNGTWHFAAINTRETMGGNDHWADYPGFAVDGTAVYVTANMFSFGTRAYGGARLWIVDKSPFYAGGTPLATVHDPPAAVGESAATMQPAHIFGSAPPNVGTWLVRYDGYSDGIDEYLSIIRVDDPLGTPIFTHQFVASGDIDDIAVWSPDAPQLGTTTLIDTGDRRTLNAVWRNGALWTTAHVVPGSPPDAGEVTAHWWNVDTSTLSTLTIADQGNVGGEDIAPGTFTFMPSIAVDEAGNMAIGFAASASTIYAGAYYAGREATDPAGTVAASEVLAAGTDYYVRTFGGSRNRWGDYSGICIDPVDDTFWVFNEYAIARGLPGGGEDGRWGTRWGHFAFGPAPPCEVVNGDFSNEQSGWTIESVGPGLGSGVQEIIDVDERTAVLHLLSLAGSNYYLSWTQTIDVSSCLVTNQVISWDWKLAEIEASYGKAEVSLTFYDSSDAPLGVYSVRRHTGDFAAYDCSEWIAEVIAGGLSAGCEQEVGSFFDWATRTVVLDQSFFAGLQGPSLNPLDVASIKVRIESYNNASTGA
ncbi:hypothetical protein K8I85_12285, partial [bacterium]|nr:hypothetical protein [bacterium]